MALKNYALITSLEELQRYVDRIIAEGKPFGFDIETGYHGPMVKKGSLKIETNFIVGISFTNSLEWARYVPLAHDMAENLPAEDVLRILRPMFLTGLGVAHNAGFELRNLARAYRETFPNDPEIQASRGYFPIRSDTLVEAYDVAEFSGTELGLKPLTLALFGHQMTEIDELFTHLPKNKMQSLRFNELDLSQKVVDYACEDALWCLGLHYKHYPLVKDKFIYKVDMGIVYCVCDMEDTGLEWDWVMMRRVMLEAEEFRSKLDAEIQEEISEAVGMEVKINLASSAQLQDIFYNKLGLKTTVMTKGGADGSNKKMSAGAKALEGLSKTNPLVAKILDWKGINKLITSYLATYEREFGKAPDGRLHPSFNSCFVVTGRFSSSGPNAQQFPKVYHYDLREAKIMHAKHAEAHPKVNGKNCECDDPEFIPPEGTCFKFNFRDLLISPEDFYILGYDLSQAELRAVAGEAKEPSLLKAFENGDDVHRLTASLVLGKPQEEVTDKERGKYGKTPNFALLYGQSKKSFGEMLGVSQEEGERIYDKYFESYSAIAAYKDKQEKYGRKHFCVWSKFGRKIPIPEYKDSRFWMQSAGDRNALNYPIQGSATGDFVRIGMIRARKKIRAAGLQDKIMLFLNVHDSLDFYVHKSLSPKFVIDLLKDEVIFPVDGWPPMIADWRIGKRWGSTKDLILHPDGSLQVKNGPFLAEPDPIDVCTCPRDEKVYCHVVGCHGGADVIEPTVVEETSTEVPAPTGEGKRLIIELKEMPDQDQVIKFSTLLKDNPGNNVVELKTPEGNTELARTTSLAIEDQMRISLTLGGAKVYYPVEDIDADVFAGMTL